MNFFSQFPGGRAVMRLLWADRDRAALKFGEKSPVRRWTFCFPDPASRPQRCRVPIDQFSHHEVLP